MKKMKNQSFCILKRESNSGLWPAVGIILIWLVPSFFYKLGAGVKKIFNLSKNETRMLNGIGKITVWVLLAIAAFLNISFPLWH